MNSNTITIINSVQFYQFQMSLAHVTYSLLVAL